MPGRMWEPTQGRANGGPASCGIHTLHLVVVQKSVIECSKRRRWLPRWRRHSFIPRPAAAVAALLGIYRRSARSEGSTRKAVPIDHGSALTLWICPSRPNLVIIIIVIIISLSTMAGQANPPTHPPIQLCIPSDLVIGIKSTLVSKVKSLIDDSITRRTEQPRQQSSQALGRRTTACVPSC